MSSLIRQTYSLEAGIFKLHDLLVQPSIYGEKEIQVFFMMMEVFGVNNPNRVMKKRRTTEEKTRW